MMIIPHVKVSTVFNGNRSVRLDYNAEIHECDEGLDLCEQICINTEGSYNCSCNAGYRLDDNGNTCAGTY